MLRPTLRCCAEAVASAVKQQSQQQQQQQRVAAYFVQRNSNGNLPVYTDIRNAGSRFIVQIRNVDGSAQALARELQETLFAGSGEAAAKVKVRAHHQHVLVTGGRWKQQVVDWLKTKGF